MNETALMNTIILRTKENNKNHDMTLFYTRLGNYFKTIHKNFKRIYGQRDDFDEKMEELVKVLIDGYINRPEDLKELDNKREQEHNWYMAPSLVGTMLYVDRFSKNLKGFKEKIDYLKEIGINYIHLMPLLKSPEGENDGGYAVCDYREVDKKFGSMKELENVSKILRENKMLLVLDLVLNHTADNHEWALKALAGDKKYQDYYYMFDNRMIPDKFEETLPEVFPDLAPGNFTYREEIKKWVFTVFNKFQWDLNYTNPDVFIEMIKIMIFLGNKGIDVLRLDAVPFLWKRLGTNSQNEPEAHTILQAMRACTKVVMPGVLFKSEAIVQPNDIVKYLGQGNTPVEECEIGYNASLMVFLWDAIATKNTRLLTKGLETMPRIPKGSTWINYIRCHDDIGLGFSDADAESVGYNPNLHRRFLVDYYTGKFYGSYATGAPFMYNPKNGEARISGSLASLAGLEKAIKENNVAEIEKAKKKILMLHSVIMAFGGVPLIYYGDELATINDYSYLDNDSQKGDNRWMHRPVINWKNAEKRKVEGTIEYEIFNGIKKMIEIRKQTKEFYGENDYEIIYTENQSVFSFLREKEDEKTLVVINFSDETQYINAGILKNADMDNEIKDLFTNSQIEIKNGCIKLERYEFLWIK